MKHIAFLCCLFSILEVGAQPKLLIGLPDTTVHQYFDSLLQHYGYPGDSVEEIIDEKGELKLHIDINIASANAAHFNGASAFFRNTGQGWQCIMQVMLANSDCQQYALDAMNAGWKLVSKNYWMMDNLPPEEKPIHAEYKDYGGAYFAMIFTREE